MTYRQVLECGTPREKAAYWALHYMEPMRYGDTPAMTHNDAVQLVHSVAAEEWEEFNRYRATFLAYIQVVTTVKLGTAYFQESKGKAIWLLRMYREWTAKEETLNDMMEDLQHYGKEVAMIFVRRLQRNDRGYSPVRLKGGRLRIFGLDTLHGNMETAIKETAEHMAELKAVVEAVENHAVHTRTRRLMPLVLRDALKTARQEAVMKNEPLFDRIGNPGGDDMPALPAWEDVERDSELYQNWRDALPCIIQEKMESLK